MEAGEDGFPLLELSALQPHAPGPEVDGHEEGHVVQQGRDDGRHGHLGIRDVGPGGENEGSGPHDGRHQLPTRAGRRFDGSGEEGFEARTAA